MKTDEQPSSHVIAAVGGGLTNMSDPKPSVGAPTRRHENGRLYFRLFLVASMLCLAVALYSADYLRVPTVRSLPYALLSVALLLAAFGTVSLAWQRALMSQGHEVSFLASLASTGLSIFGKYIPGKVWLVVGRAGYVAQAYDLPLKRLSIISFNVQLLGIWTALSIGCLGLGAIIQDHQIFWVVAIAWSALTFSVFTSKGHELASQIAERILKRPLPIPNLGLSTALKLAPFWLATWALRSVGFYFLVFSLVSNAPPPAIGLVFPLAVSLGVIAFFLPDGLGVREGLITAGLVGLGMRWGDAASIAVVARLWTLLGDVSIFLVSAMIHWATKSTRPTTKAAKTNC